MKTASLFSLQCLNTASRFYNSSGSHCFLNIAHSFWANCGKVCVSSLHVNAKSDWYRCFHIWLRHADSVIENRCHVYPLIGLKLDNACMHAPQPPQPGMNDPRTIYSRKLMLAYGILVCCLMNYFYKFHDSIFSNSKQANAVFSHFLITTPL